MSDNSHSHTHPSNCGHCAAYTIHKVESTTYVYGPGIHNHTHNDSTYTQDGPGAPTHSHQAVPGCNGGCTRLDTICKSLQMTNMSISAELERLKLEVSRIKSMQPGDTTTMSHWQSPQPDPHPHPHPHPHGIDGDALANFWGTDKVIAWGNGAGAGSREIYEEMCRTSWHGRLGRTTMAEVDRLSPEKLKDLDDFLHRNIAVHFPFGDPLIDINMEMLWAGFREIGLKLEERTYFADVTDPEEHSTWPTMQRMRNRVAWCHKHSGRWGWYWNGLAIETLLECARYRGLFRSDGTLP